MTGDAHSVDRLVIFALIIATIIVASLVRNAMRGAKSSRPKQCRRCGETLPPFAKFCRQCGESA